MRYQRQLTLSDRFRCVAQGLADIFELELGKLSNDHSCVWPSAAMNTTVATGMRKSRIQGSPRSGRDQRRYRERHSPNRLWQRPYLLS